MTHMTRAFDDVEAVTSLLREKEKDLELAAEIGKELLERNRRLEERVSQMELQLSASSEIMTQLRHDLATKTDLLRVYAANSDDVGDDNELRAVSVHLLERKIQDLEKENAKLHDEATELAKEAIEVEAKEERLVSDAVKHLSEANMRINHLSAEFSTKSDESRKQKEEITHLLAQICDLQSRCRRLGTENGELHGTVRVYRETQDELTGELSDLREKYREVAELLADTRRELRAAKKRSADVYVGVAKHNVETMFDDVDGHTERTGESSLKSELDLSLRGQKSPFEGNLSYDRTFNTFRLANAPSVAAAAAVANVMASADVYRSYTISRDHTMSPDFLTLAIDTKDEVGSSEFKAHRQQEAPFKSQLTSYGDFELGRTVHAIPSEQPGANIVEVQTVGELRVPEVSEDALASPLGSVPSRGNPASAIGIHVPLGSVPGQFAQQTSQERVPMELGQIPTRPVLFGSGDQAYSDRGLGSLTLGGAFGQPSAFGAADFDGSFNLESGAESLLSYAKRVDDVADGMSDDDVALPEDFLGGSLSKHAKTELSEPLSAALQKLTPAEVERRRSRMVSTHSYDLGSDGFDSPSSALLGMPGFQFMPYGVRTPDSIMSTGSMSHAAAAVSALHGGGGGASSTDYSSLGYYGSSSGTTSSAMWRLPEDKLRIVKPLEGSLTLHHWQRLARPHLGNILEERSGVAVKGEGLSYFDSLRDDISLDGLEEARDEPVTQRPEDTRLLNTITNSRVLHPEAKYVGADTFVTDSYGNRSHMSSGFNVLSRPSSRMSVASSSMAGNSDYSRRDSIGSDMSSLMYDNVPRGGALGAFGTLTFSSSLGLARVLNERHIHGYLSGSSASLDTAGNGSKAGSIADLSFSADVASINSLTPSVISSPVARRRTKGGSFELSRSPTHTPADAPATPAVTPTATPPNEPSTMSSESNNPGLVLGFFASLRAALYGEQQKEAAAIVRSKKRNVERRGKKRFGILEKVEEVGVENLLSASPCPSLVASSSREASLDRMPECLDKDELEDIAPGSLTTSSLARDSRKVYVEGDLLGVRYVMGGRGPGRVTAPPGEKRPALAAALGVPGQPGTGALYRMRSDLGSVPATTASSVVRRDGDTTGFIGTLTTMFFGRKGGLL